MIPGVSDRYLQTLDTYCQLYKLPQQLDGLFHLAQAADLDLLHFQNEMEQFDKIKVDGM